MAANQNTPARGSQSNSRGTGQSPFFNQSLSGGLTVQSLSGPLLFTPVPLSSPTKTSQSVDESASSSQTDGSLGYQSPFQSPFAEHQQGPSSNYQNQQPMAQPDLFPVQMNQQTDQVNQPFEPVIGAPFGQVQTQFHNNPYSSPHGSTTSMPQPATVEQYTASPGMQYMSMPFQDDAPRPELGIGYQEQPSYSPKPTQVVPPQPQAGQLPGPQLYTPTGQPSYSSVFLYQPVQPHWFYHRLDKSWLPFSFVDSRHLEAAYTSRDKTVVATDGGRYDVDLDSMKREAVYWNERRADVRRCTWFYRGEGELKLIPYEESIAEILEKEFKVVATTGAWGKKIDLQKGESVVFHNANVIVHYLPNTELYDWTGEDSKTRPRVVRRGISDLLDEIVEGEPEQIDHLVFVVHGIGPAADLRMRPLIECVEDMRQQGLSQLGTHQFVKEGIPVGRVEFLPIEWYSNLHSDRHGVDSRLNAITLSSIGKFRSFTNETLTDILFFTSPMYCQAICDTVVQEMNRLLDLFKSRHPSFQGEISVCGHSLGSCILFDILANQGHVDSQDSFEEVVEETVTRIAEGKTESSTADDDLIESRDAPPPVVTHSLSQTYASTVQEDSIPDIDEVLRKLNLTDYSSKFHDEKVDTETLLMCSEADMRDLGIPMGPRKKLMGFVREQAQKQEKTKTKDTISESKTSSGVLYNPASAEKLKTEERKMAVTKGTQTYLARAFSSASVEVPYERGVAGTGQPTVRYAKLNFEPANMFAVGSPIGLFVTVRGVTSFGLNFKLPTCGSFYNIFHPYDPVAYRIEPLVNSQIDLPPVLMPHHKGRKRFHLELRENLTRVGANLKQGFIEAVRSTWATINQFARSHRSEDKLETDGELTETAVVKPMQSNDGEKMTGLQDIGHQVSDDPTGVRSNCGKLNNGKRIDFVLQERPLESLNEYLFALSSHTCYWTSEDTVLLMLRAIYGAE